MFTLFHHFHPRFFIPSPRVPGSELVVPLFDTSRKCLGAAMCHRLHRSTMVHSRGRAATGCTLVLQQVPSSASTNRKAGWSHAKPCQAMPSHAKRQWPSRTYHSHSAAAQAPSLPKRTLTMSRRFGGFWDVIDYYYYIIYNTYIYTHI